MVVYFILSTIFYSILFLFAHCFICLFFKFFFNVCLSLRKRQNTSGGRAERQGDREPEAGSRLGAVSTEPNVGLKLRLRDHDRHSTN